MQDVIIVNANDVIAYARFDVIIMNANDVIAYARCDYCECQ